MYDIYIDLSMAPSLQCAINLSFFQMPLCTHIILAADSSTLGRVDKSTFSQLALMEILTQDLTVEGFRYLSDAMCDEANLQDWAGISVNTFGDVSDIDWSLDIYRGKVDLQWLPSTVEKIKFTNANDMEVILQLDLLPVSVRELKLSWCTCRSSVDLRELPQFIAAVWLIQLDLQGTLPLDHLPPTLYDLHLTGNSFAGTVSLKNLPNGMLVLYLDCNKLHGTIDVTRLPPGMQELDISSNGFEGVTDFSQLPKSLEHLDVSGTNLSGEIAVDEERMYFDGSRSQVRMVSLG